MKHLRALKILKQALAGLLGVPWGGGGTRGTPQPECPAELASRLCRSN